MEIQKFSLQDFLESVKSSTPYRYHSELYQKEFPLTGNDLLAKIEPVRREDIGILLPHFDLAINSSVSNFQGHPYKFYPNEYFLFRYKIKTPGPNGRNIHIRFRTKSDDKLIDDFLEFLQESSIVRYCCNQSLSNLPLEDEKLMDTHKYTVDDNLWLVDNPQQMLSNMKRSRRKKWIEDKLLNFFDALDQMKKAGYEVSQVVNKIRSIEIPSDKESKDILWESATKILTLSYKNK